MAYYHAVTRICDTESWNFSPEYVKALKRSFAQLAMGSAFKHGSDTSTGGTFDTIMIRIISQLGYESVIEKIGTDNEILININDEHEKHSAFKASQIMTEMTISQPVIQWQQTMWNIPLEHYYKTFGAMWMFAFVLIFPKDFTDYVLPIMARKFIEHKEKAEFLVTKYLPALNKVVEEKNLNISLYQKVIMTKKFIGMIMKIGYAFIWQEYQVNFPKLYDESTLSMGA